MSEVPCDQRDVVEILYELAEMLERNGDKNIVPAWVLSEAADELKSRRQQLSDIKTLVNCYPI